MIDYHTYCKIHDLKNNHGLDAAQIARQLALDLKTVKKWLAKDRFEPPATRKRKSKIEPWKPKLQELLRRHDYTAIQLYQMIRKEGYDGKYTILTDFIRQIRPPKKQAFLSLSFAPGECAQVDFGQYGAVQVGNTSRQLSFFVMVLCYSRMIYLEFILKQSMEHFLTCHQNAFNFFGGVPEKVMVDNCKVAILKHSKYEAPVPNPRYADFASHCQFTIKACGIGKGNEKGRVENAVGYVKKNLLNGMDIATFTGLNDIARDWMDNVANVRIHRQLRERPLDRFEKEKSALAPLPTYPYDCAVVVSGKRADCQFRVAYESNKYSVPAEYASTNGLHLRVYPDIIAIYCQDKLIARHQRSYNRSATIANEDHDKELLNQRRNARQQRLLKAFLALTPIAEEYYSGLNRKRLNPSRHMRKIMALVAIYGEDPVARAINDACSFEAFSSDYILNVLEQRQRHLPEKGPLHLTHKQDLLDLSIDQPDLTIYNLDS